MNPVISPQTLYIHGDNVEYTLDSIICHSGVHYYAKIRIGDNLFICNDANAPQLITDAINGPEDYIFMYSNKANVKGALKSKTKI